MLETTACEAEAERITSSAVSAMMIGSHAEATVARDTPNMYGTPTSGSNGPTSWAKPKPGQGSWTAPCSSVRAQPADQRTGI